MEEIDIFLKRRAEEGCLRRLRAASGRKNGMISVAGRDYIDFSSNDYLGLSNHPKLIEKAKEALGEFGTGACASRLLSGDLELHHQLEEAVASFKNKEAGLVFNSGYQANVGILSSLYSRGDAIFSDRLNHASIVDGMLLSGAKIFRFIHNDPGHLESLLKKERPKFKKALIVTETLFSMDGDRPPLKELTDLKDKYDCKILVDEAHATGIYGPNGSGIVEEEGLTGRTDFIMGTFSKALGSFGAYLAASKNIIEYLINTSRGFIYSTALPPSVIAVNLASLKLVKEEPQRRKSLLESARYLRDRLIGNGFSIRGSSQIVPLIIGDSMKTVRYSKTLQEKGHWVLPIRPPSVPQGEARLRFSLTVHHDIKILQRLIDDIAAIGI